MREWLSRGDRTNTMRRDERVVKQRRQDEEKR